MKQIFGATFLIFGFYTSFVVWVRYTFISICKKCLWAAFSAAIAFSLLKCTTVHTNRLDWMWTNSRTPVHTHTGITPNNASLLYSVVIYFTVYSSACEMVICIAIHTFNCNYKCGLPPSPKTIFWPERNASVVERPRHKQSTTKCTNKCNNFHTKPFPMLNQKSLLFTQIQIPRGK